MILSERSKIMDKRRGLTRIELMVLVGAVVFILLLVLLTQHRTQKRPRLTVACMAKLKQWNVVFEMYASDNDNHFFSGEDHGDEHWWIDATQSYWHTVPDIMLCPKAMKPIKERGRNASSAWKVNSVSGSYGLSGWICDPPQEKTELWGHGPFKNYWRTPDVNEADNVPVFFDAMWPETWPEQTDKPPESTIQQNAKGMQRVCCNRHEGYVNVLFMDGSVRRVGLKELWKLKWHRNYNTDGPWTITGGAQPMKWPEWMRNFRDY
jgi:prepilin-type processing-associated H-X9-DG protein